MRYDPPDGTAARSLPPRVLSSIWAAGSVAWLALALILAFGAVSWLPRQMWPSFGLDHGIELATIIVTWGVLGMAGAAAVARVLLGGVAILHRNALAVAGAGLVIVAALQVTLHTWAVAKLGYYEPEIIGPTSLLPFGIAALAVALFGIAVAPRAFDLAPRIAVCAGGLLALATIVLNISGAIDGIAPGAVPLAIALAVSSAWVICACWVAVRR